MKKFDLKGLLNRIQKRPRRVQWALAGAAAALLLALGWSGFSGNASKSEIDPRVQQEAEALAVAVAKGLAAYETEIDKLVVEPQLIELLQRKDERGLRSLAEAWRPRFPRATEALILPAERAGLHDTRLEGSLGFASMDMIRRAGQGEQVKAEVHMLGTPTQRLVMVRSVRAKNDLVSGVLHLSTAVEPLQALAIGLDPGGGGYFELHQPVPGSGGRVILAAKGDKELKHSVTPVHASVARTNWVLNFWSYKGPAQKEGAGGERGMSILIVALLLAGGLGGGLYYRSRAALNARSQSTNTLPETSVAEVGAAPLAAQVTPVEKPVATETTTTELPQTPEPAEAAEKALEEEEKLEEGPPPESIFRAYDIRGVVGRSLTERHVYQIGLAIGSEAGAKGLQKLAVGRDGRHSSPALAERLAKGLLASGRDVIDVGQVPTPVLYFATHYFETGSGIMVTGSHNPPEYNGLKIVLGGETLSGETIKAIRTRIASGDLSSGAGTLEREEVISAYVYRITEDIPVVLGHSLKVVIDCGNGVPGAVAPQLLRALGHDVVELFCDVDGRFPNHHPDPSQPENLHALIERVKEDRADLGLAFDGDGDRLGVVDGQGNILWPDRQMMLFARDLLKRNPGATVIFDVKCSNHLRRVIQQAGGTPLMWKTGHSLIKSKMKETGALLAGEMSGHIFFKERWYGFDDALYAAARLLEILVEQSKPAAAVFAELPGGVATPELRLDMPEERHAQFMHDLVSSAQFETGEVFTVDGLRVDFKDGWGLVRASNTTPCLVLRFEGDHQAALKTVQERFKEKLLALDPTLKLPF
ncbi:MAG: phosphomannomutase/phosphoglucomutase [Gammaproteobacteria bacterium]